jgi:hypothetical protein
MLATIVYYIWKERNACFFGDTPRTSSMIYRDIVSCIILKVNLIRSSIDSSITNRRLHIV